MKVVIDRRTWLQADRSPALVTLLDRPNADMALDRAIRLNDVPTLDGPTREWAIQQALTPLGLELEFVN